jgi:hypothetical protein|tara:strand:+ start:216 stop:395 length:180 start_codon:yes stop_codon:yes gene_type:complete
MVLQPNTNLFEIVRENPEAHRASSFNVPLRPLIRLAHIEGAKTFSVLKLPSKFMDANLG